MQRPFSAIVADRKNLLSALTRTVAVFVSIASKVDNFLANASAGFFGCAELAGTKTILRGCSLSDQVSRRPRSQRRSSSSLSSRDSKTLRVRIEQSGITAL
jgi:hypothetical protein